jgi:hypothetical protein
MGSDSGEESCGQLRARCEYDGGLAAAADEPDRSTTARPKAEPALAGDAFALQSALEHLTECALSFSAISASVPSKPEHSGIALHAWRGASRGAGSPAAPKL